MKRILKIFVACGLLTTVIVSCATPSTYPPNPMPSPTLELQTDWWISWLAHPVCKPPCWQNITPGVTTRDEAVSILKNIPDIAITYNGEYSLSWEHKSKLEGGNISISEDEVVSSISLGSISERKLLLETIITSYDEPEFVKPFDCNIEVVMCYVALIYPDLGMFLEIYTANKGVDGTSPKFEISLDNAISRVDFFKSGIENFPNLYNAQESEVPIPWKGFGTYP